MSLRGFAKDLGVTDKLVPRNDASAWCNGKTQKHCIRFRSDVADGSLSLDVNGPLTDSSTLASLFTWIFNQARYFSPFASNLISSLLAWILENTWKFSCVNARHVALCWLRAVGGGTPVLGPDWITRHSPRRTWDRTRGYPPVNR